MESRTDIIDIMDFIKEDIVISGIGGYFPKALNVGEFKEKLYSNESLVEPKWPDGMYIFKISKIRQYIIFTFYIIILNFKIRNLHRNVSFDQNNLVFTGNN